MNDEKDATVPTVDLRATTPGDPDAPPTVPSQEGIDAALVGRRLGHFEVGELLGEGGMGSVWTGHDTSLDRTVALKLLPPGVAPTTLERFRREARAQARMSHHNVVQIYFVGEDDGQQYFAMEWVDGESLAERIADGPIGWEEALQVCLQAARGLAHASARGLVHRDVKPANIMIGAGGDVKVADFGIAKRRETTEFEESGDIRTTDAPDLTGLGSFIGTPLYAAPEQIRGTSVDRRADIYSLGVTLYHAIVGTPPFTGTTFELLQSHQRGEVPWERLPAETPPRVRAILEAMLQKDANERLGTYEELIDAIERALPQYAVPAELPARLAAAAIDVGPLVLLPLMLNEPWIARPLFTLLEPFYLVVPILLWHQTLGQRLAKIHVVDVHGDRARPITLIARAAIMIGGLVAFDLIKAPAVEMAVVTLYYGAFVVTGLFTAGDRLPPDLLTATRLVHQRPSP